MSDMLERNYHYQWFIISVTGGKEQSIKKSLEEKMENFGYYGKEVKEFRVFMTNQVTEEIFSKNDPKLPATLRNTKTSTWIALPDSKYKKIKTKSVNRFPRYIFVNMEFNPEIWYAIRNTIGVLGFIGSTGKGSMPTPIHISEFENILKTELVDQYAAKIKESQEHQKVETVQKASEEKSAANDENNNFEASNVALNQGFKVGNTVEIISGGFAGQKAQIVSLNDQKGVARIEFEFFGRINSFEISYNDIKLEN